MARKKRSSPEDAAFRRRVAEEFTHARERAAKKGFSADEFAQHLGVTRAAVHKYTTGTAIPSLRVLQKARRYWGVQIPYGDLGETYVRSKRTDPRQMNLHLSLENVSKEQIEVRKFAPSGDQSIELLIRIDFSKSA